MEGLDAGSGLTKKERGGLVYLQDARMDAAGVAGLFTTRLGGVSEGNFASLNLGVSRGDNICSVHENYRRICGAIGANHKSTVFGRQVHGTGVHVAREEDAGLGLMRPSGLECDAYITNVPGLVLTVFTADCVPVLICDPVNRAVGAVHAGWRGTMAGVVENTLKKMAREFGSRFSQLLCAIGPCIGACCFEVGEDVYKAAAGLEGGARFIREAGPGRWYVDLKGINRSALEACGVAAGNVSVSPMCTSCSPELFWSHRRAAGPRGSQAAMICIRRPEPDPHRF